MIPLIVALPLFGCMLSYLIAKINGRDTEISGIVATCAVFGSFLLTVLLTSGLGESGPIRSELLPWLSYNEVRIPLAYHFDKFSAVMTLLVTGAGTLIHLYSISYMHGEETGRFFSYLNLFVFSMLNLVLGENLAVVFIGWEGVGLCSYLLIGYWYSNRAYASAGMKAFVVNRIGDMGMLLAMFIMLKEFGTLDLSALSDLPATSAVYLIGLFLFVGATGKSAQFPLFVWLPDAMAGPTPVSALIHAATMVTAGVYLMVRASGILELMPDLRFIILLVGVITSFYAALVACAQNDIKKVLAYSTVSQLGFMFTAIGLGHYWVAIFHVLTHAFFKAGLFLSAGAVIHSCHHNQDMREMGGLRKYMPVTFACYGVYLLAIGGVFPFSGYFSKHLILDGFSSSGLPANFSGAVLVLKYTLTVTAFLTAFYVARSFFMTFFNEYRGHVHPHEVSPVMYIPLVFFAVLATIGGYLEYVLPAAFGEVLEHKTIAEIVISGLKGSILAYAGIGLAYALYGRRVNSLDSTKGTNSSALGVLVRIAQDKFYIDEIYSVLIVEPLRTLAFVTWRVGDVLGIDWIVNSLGYSVQATGEVVRRAQCGDTRFYAFMIALFMLLVPWFLL